ncbi:MAG: DUF5318 domain-containing protein [Actinomycetota bacterium]|nr:DUF5318 domain-containing protein [Actinomycetota bacterium]
MQGLVDYTLAKRSVLESWRRGALDRLDICDAHPELIRAARNIGLDVMRACPVCGNRSLKQVRYVYGDQLKHLSGRVVYPIGWELELNAQFDEFRCYAVEVCVDCSWNHLAACYLMGRRFEGGPTTERPQRNATSID